MPIDMPTCATCKYWDTTKTYNKGLGRCMNVPMYFNCIEWDEEGNAVLRDEYKHCKAFAQDGSDYMARLDTMPDFGCNCHEPKEQG